MNATDIIAYAADADTYCPDCAREIYGAAALGECPDCGGFMSNPAHGEFLCVDCQNAFHGALDGEGNEVHPVFADSWSEFEESGLFCGQCGEEIIPAAEAEEEVRKCAYCGQELPSEEEGEEGVDWFPRGHSGDGPLCPECYRDDLPTIQGSNWLALSLLDWHGGQGSPSYGVGSCWHALREVPVPLAWEAYRELLRVPGAQKVAFALGSFLEGSGYPEGREPWAD